MWICHAIGEGCWSWRLGDAPDLELSKKILAHYRDLKDHPPKGVQDVVPAYTEIAVHFDPIQTDAARLRDEVETQLSQPLLRRVVELNVQTHHLSVMYDGPDLEQVATHTGLTVRQVIQRHTHPLYTVAMIGFMPHFPYCLGFDPVLQVPRLSSPRPVVPAGSVALAGVQTGVYPQESPGGWNLLGRTDPQRLKAIRPGDQIRFEAVEVLP